MKRPLITVFTILSIVVGGIGFLAANYYSVLADLRETFADVDTTDEYLYGETLFQTRGCVFCHTLEAANASAEVGPYLDGIGSRFDTEYIRESIVSPDAIIATNCPEEACEAGTMPNFGQVLDEAQVDALVVYLSAQK